MDGVTHQHGQQNVLREFQHGQARALNHGLQDETFNQRVGQRARYRPAFNSAPSVALFDEDGFQHAGAGDEVDQVGLCDGAAIGAEPLADGQVLPHIALAQQYSLGR